MKNRMFRVFRKILALAYILQAAMAVSVSAGTVPPPLSFGYDPDSEVTDCVRTAAGRLLVCGILAGAAEPPGGTQTHTLLPGEFAHGKRGFIGEVDPTTWALKWISLFPADAFEPSRMVVSASGDIVLGGRHGPTLVAHDRREQNWTKSKGALACISPDGQRLRWFSPAGPNQDVVTGLCVEGDRVYFSAGSAVRQAANYLLRKDLRTGENLDWTQTGWCVYLHPNQEPLKAPGQALALYQRPPTDPDGRDLDGPGGWGPVKFWLQGYRMGGQVLALPDGDVVVSSGLQYDFQVKGDKKFPAFDLFLARYSPEGELRWSTNLYQEGDSVHTPDQKPVDLAYDPKADILWMVAKQHGSNLYRLKGGLVGDTGNLMISWVGRVRARDGVLEQGWYFQNNRHGKYDSRGAPASPPYPKLAGNALNRILVLPGGQVALAGTAGPKMWTSPDAFEPWPADKDGGGEAALVILPQSLESPVFASTFFTSQSSSARVGGMALLNNRLILAGAGVAPGRKEPGCLVWQVPLPETVP